MSAGRPERECHYLKARLRAISTHTESIANRTWFSDFFECSKLLNVAQCKELHTFFDCVFTELYRPELPVKEAGAGALPDDMKDKAPPIWLKDAPALKAFAREPVGSWVFALPAPPVPGEETADAADLAEFFQGPLQASSESAAGLTRSCIPDEGLVEATAERRRKAAEVRERKAEDRERARQLTVPGADGRVQRDPVTGFEYLPVWEPQHALYPPFATHDRLLDAFEQHIACFPEDQRDNQRDILKPWAYGPGCQCPAEYWEDEVHSQAAIGALKKETKLALREEGYVIGQAAETAASVVCAIAAQGTKLAREPSQQVFALKPQQREQHWLERLFVLSNLVQTVRDIAARDAELREEHCNQGVPEQRLLPLWAQIVFTHIVWACGPGGLLDTPQPDYTGPNLDTFLLPGPTLGVGPDLPDDESAEELQREPSVASKAAAAENFGLLAVAAQRSTPSFARGPHGDLIPIDVVAGGNHEGKRRREDSDFVDADSATPSGSGGAGRRGRGQ